MQQSAIQEIRMEAEKARTLYKSGIINRDQAKELISPYIQLFNERSKEIAKKYHQKPRTITFAKYIR